MRGHSPMANSRIVAAPRRRAGRFLAVAALAAAALGAGAGSAGASAPIEGIWSFTGGRVGIQGQGHGTFVGTVVAPTRFADCTHEVGERMWTGITAESDGSYWGQHQWYYG